MLPVFPKPVVLFGIVILSSLSSWAQQPQQDSAAALKSRIRVLELAGVPSGQVVVTYENAKLTIKSNGALFIDVLRVVCSHIGAELEAASVADDVVLGIMGPGEVRDVLAAMLAGSSYELATAGSPEDPNSIQRIVILSKRAESADSANDGSDTPPAKDSSAQNQATEPGSQALQTTAASTSTASDVETRISEVRENFAQAHAELEQIARAANLDMGALLKEAEAQAKAEADPDSSAIPSAAVAQIKRPRGRSRHTH